MRDDTDGRLSGEGNWDHLTQQLHAALGELVRAAADEAIRKDLRPEGWQFQVEHKLEYDESTLQMTFRLVGRWVPVSTWTVEPNPDGGFYAVEHVPEGYDLPRGWTYPAREQAERALPLVQAGNWYPPAEEDSWEAAKE